MKVGQFLRGAITCAYPVSSSISCGCLGQLESGWTTFDRNESRHFARHDCRLKSLALEKLNRMKTCLKSLPTLLLCFGLAQTIAEAQTAGTAKLEANILDYTGTSGASHYAVVWVTTQAGAFVKSLRKQGPSNWTSSEWGSHCSTWNTARAGSTVLDGYSSATATSYTGTNSPIVLNWNCRDASNNLMPDGNYKFWIQYAENSGQGPVTTSGLLWTKGATSATNTFANQGVNFANMKVTWTATTPPALPIPPNFTTFQVIGGNLVMSGTGPTNVTYTVLIATNANALTAQWTAIATNSFNSVGQFRFTNTINASVSGQFYRLKVP